MASDNGFYAKLVGPSNVHIRGACYSSAVALHKAITDKSAAGDYHERIALAMQEVARTWSPVSMRPIPIFVHADVLLERDGEAATIAWGK